MKCFDCPYSEENKSCPCVEKTIADIQRIEEKKQYKKEKNEDYYFRMSIARSRSLGDR